MSERSRAAWLLASALALWPAVARAAGRLVGGTIAVQRDVAAVVGGVATGGGMALNSTVGEAADASASGAGYSLTPGYITLAAQPGSVVSLTAVTKATGTLVLAWTAPGADGSLGNVTNGFYRVDYSSDASHAFSPTTYQTEFATTVVAGSAQQVAIDSLLPNTTYYAKVYLADARKAFAEDSARDDDSTLANAPDPQFSSVFACSATITWPLPSGGAEGFGTVSSTSSALTGTTKNGSTTQLTFTLTGLSPSTTYYLKVASLNWQGDKNYSVIIGTLTPSGTCLPTVLSLAVSGDARGRSVSLSWANPTSPAPQGIIVLMSTNTTESLTDGQTFTAGQTLPDGARVKSAGVSTSLADSGLTLDTTYFYHVFAEYSGVSYSVAVSTSLFLDLSPMTPANVTAVADSGRTTATIGWHTVQANEDGSGFKSSGSPIAPELSYYRIERSTSATSPYWVAVTTVAAAATSYADSISGLGATLLYRVVSVDSLGNKSPSVAVDLDDASAFLFSSDQVTHIKLPPSLYAQVLGNSLFSGADTVLRITDTTPTRDGIKAVRVDAVPAVGAPPSAPVQLSKPQLQVVLSYAGGTGTSSLGTRPSDAQFNSYGAFWNNGSSYVNLYGQVDPQSQTVSVNTGLTGTYEIRQLARTQGFDFDIAGRTNRIITPNGDNLNDVASFIYDNPRSSAVSGKIYDVGGGYVSDMQECPTLPSGPGQGCIQWDGKAGGRTVSGGVYVYQIRAEDKAFSGTIVVIR